MIYLARKMSPSSLGASDTLHQKLHALKWRVTFLGKGKVFLGQELLSSCPLSESPDNLRQSNDKNVRSELGKEPKQS